MEKRKNIIAQFFEEWLEVPVKEGLIELFGTALFVIGGYICLILILMIV